MGAGKVRILVIVGPTASGKSELAIRLARELDGEVIGADSLQVYRGFDVGSAKLPPSERCGIPHHLIDVADPDQEFTAADYVHHADRVIEEVARRGKLPIVAGGTGLYVRALLHGLVPSPGGDPAFRVRMDERAAREGNGAVHRLLQEVDPVAAAAIHPNNLVRIVRALEVYYQTGRPLSSFWNEHRFGDERYHALVFGLAPPRDLLDFRIDRRVGQMLESGLVDEVRGLVSRYPDTLKPFGAIGYREVILHLRGGLTLDGMKEEIGRNTKRYARRQLTWFRREAGIKWVEYPENFDTIRDIAIQFIAQGVK